MTATNTEAREHFEALVERAEAHLKQNPSGYKRKLMWLAWLGYAYLFGIMLLIVSLLAGSGYIAIQSSALFILLIKTKLIFLLVGVLFVMLRALWVKIPEPEGYILARKDFPHLFAEINRLRKQLDAPRIHQVILTPELNAAIQQTPRLGVFGWQKNTLILGAELLMNLSEEEALAVIGHELGHLSGNHSRFNGWIYRIRRTWGVVMDAFNQANYWARLFFGRFMNWYAPYFNAYSFALARANEFEADAAAVKVTSQQALVNGLLRFSTSADLVSGKYWEGLIKQADQRADIERQPYSSMLAFIRQNVPDGRQQSAALNRALDMETGHADTHPATKDRIAPYVQQPDIPPPVGTTAAEAFLGDKLEPLLSALDETWVQNNQRNWRERFEYAEKARQALTELDAKPDDEKTADDWFSLGEKTEEFIPDKDPTPLYQKALELDADHAWANYALGRRLLDDNDEAGIGHLERSMHNHQAVIPACELIYHYWQRHGDKARAEEYLKKAETQQDLYDAANAERDEITVNDTYKAPTISQEEQQAIAGKLSLLPTLKHAWLAEKELKHFPEQKILVMIFTKKAFEGKDKELLEQIKQDLDSDHTCYVLNKKGEYAALAKEVMKHAVQLV